MAKEIKAQVETITPEQAKILLKFNTSNRPVSKTVVEEYARQMTEGLWKVNGEAIIISDGNVLVNGQHRLEACVLSGVPLQTLVVRGVDALSYNTIDTGRGRTGGDMLGALGIPHYNQKAALVAKYFAISESGRSVISSGTAVIRAHKSKQEIVSFYKEHSQLIDGVTSFSETCRSKMNLMTISQVGGTMLHLILDKHHSIEVVEDFFRQVFYAENVSNSTILLLRDKLLKDKIGQYKLASPVKGMLLIKTWNAFVKGKEYKVLNVNMNTERQIQFI